MKTLKNLKNVTRLSNEEQKSTKGGYLTFSINKSQCESLGFTWDEITNTCNRMDEDRSNIYQQ